MDLDAWSSRLKVFADATRVRLLALLEGEELTVAELSAITQLAQPRVSTHLARLKEAGIVRDRRAGVSAYYRFDEDALDHAQRALWQTLRAGSTDPLLRQDAERVAAVLAMRASDQNWGDSVAGDMSLTDHFAMLPAASVSGWYFSHPRSQYFVVGRVSKEQVEDYARRKGVSLQQAERWLASNLDYDPE